MVLVISLVLACVLILFLLLLLWSYPGDARPFLTDEGKPLPGSISEKVFVRINGVEQGMFIKGKDTRNPVLLYLHGGLPDYFLTQAHPTGLDEHFCVVWWEQRGSGLSFGDDIPPSTMTVEQCVSDALEVTSYLRRRFGKEKIYLMGHSGGTFIGIQAVAQAPELFHAYIGVAQMSNQRTSEVRAYDYMLSQFKQNGNTRMVQKLEAVPVSLEGGVPDAYFLIRDEAMHSLGVGTMHEMRSILAGIFLPSLQFREYTLGEKIKLWRGKIRSGVSSLWVEMMATDLNKTIPKLDIPVYFFHGIHDYTVSYPEARSFFDHLKAPVKGFYTFERSAHSPMFEEPERTVKIMLNDVLRGVNHRADPT